MMICTLDLLLKRENITAIDLSRELNINKDVVIRLKNNKSSRYSMKMLDNICTFFKCQLDDLFTLENRKEREKGDV